MSKDSEGSRQACIREATEQDCQDNTRAIRGQRCQHILLSDSHEYLLTLQVLSFSSSLNVIIVSVARRGGECHVSPRW